MLQRFLVTLMCALGACHGKADTPDAADAPATPSSEPEFPFGAKDDALGKAIVDVMAYDFTVPETGAESSRLVQAATAGKAALAADPAAAEARVLPPCKAAAADNGPLQFVCMDLLGAFETPATLAWLSEVAQSPLVKREPATDTDVTEADAFVPKVFQVHRALAALAERGRAGGSEARAALLDAAVQSDPSVQGAAIGAALDALPRAAARQELLKRLDPSLHHLVYAHP